MIRLILFIIITLSCLSCSTYLKPMETVVRDSLYISQRMIDRILIRDSIFERQVHDTIYKYRERETVRYLSLRDTLYIERRDSVIVPVPVEKKLTKWQQTRMRLGDVSITAIILGIIYVVLWLIKLRSR